jgi:hypothetical protein
VFLKVEITKKHKESKQKKKKKNMKKMKREKERRTKDNLILSHVNLTFVLIGSYTFTHTYCTLQKSVFKCEKWSNLQIKFASNWSLKFWTLDPHLKWPLVFIGIIIPSQH